MSDEPEASRSAVLVAQARAVADGRQAVGRFSDPVARELLTPAERAAVDRARDQTAPVRWRERVSYEMLRATADHMAVRTVAVDAAIREARQPQVVLLGAGLDARAWRLTELAGASVFEVDHPASQADKRARVRRAADAGGLALRAARHAYVAVDLARTRLGPALTAAGFDSSLPTTWIWEGVVMYLTPAQVAATLAQVETLSVGGSILVLHYTTRTLVVSLGRAAYRRMARPAGVDPLAREPNRSAWSPRRISALLGDHGFDVVRDGSLLELAERMGLTPQRAGSLRAGRLLVARRTGGA